MSDELKSKLNGLANLVSKNMNHWRLLTKSRTYKFSVCWTP